MSCTLGDTRLGCTGAAVGDDRQGAIIGDSRRCAVIGCCGSSNILSCKSDASHEARASREVTSRNSDASTEIGISGVASRVGCFGGAVLVIGTPDFVRETSLGVVIGVMLALLVVKLFFGKGQSRSESEVDRRCGQDILANHVD